MIDWNRTVLPVLRLGDGESVPEAFGSAVVLNVKGQYFAVTAAHVLEGEVDGSLWLPGNDSRIMVLPERRFTTLKDAADQASVTTDEIDIALVPLDENDVKNLDPDFVVTPIEWVSTEPPDPASFYTFVGYPASKFKVDYPRRKGGVAKYVTISGGLAKPERWTLASKTTSTHIVLFFDKKKAVNEQGARAIPPDPHGMSGAAVWVNAVGSDKEPRLAGIGIEYRATEFCLVATRIGCVVEAIRAIRPDLSGYLPRMPDNDMGFYRSEE
ncbi:MAG: hypothetical protein HY897_02775 [Deltaproteobacteria bacterium]|nr:hypothetical protein [Deltaproteobacteria bacterium]